MRFLKILISFSIFFYSTCIYAQPLRIWVMHNEPVEAHGKITAERIRKGIEHWRAQGIIIENSVQNLTLPAETKNPLASYIIGRNSFLEELMHFRRHEATQEPIAIEFLRWDDAYSRITGALMSDGTSSVPDVVQAGHSWIAEMANKGRVADLSKRIELDQFYSSSLIASDAFEQKGIYAIPWFREMRLLYYNRAMVKSPSDLATWKGFLRASKSFSNDGGKRFFAFPLTITWNLLHNLAPWLWASGGDLARVQQFGPFKIYRVTIDSPESIRALLYLKELAASGTVDFPRVSQEIVDRNFRDGKYAAVISGPWMTKLLGDGWSSKFGVAPVPAGPKGSFPFVGGSHLMISHASHARGNFKRAVALVQHLTSRDAQLRFVASTGFYPVNRAALDEVLKSDRDGTLKSVMEVSLAYPAMPDWGKIVENELIRSHIWHIWRDISQVVSDEALKDTARNTASALRIKLISSFAKRYAPAASLALGIMIFLASGSMIWLRWRYRKARRLFEQKSLQLKRIEAEHALLEAKALLMEKRREEQSESFSKLKDDLAKLRCEADRLREELARTSKKKKPGIDELIGRFHVDSTGLLIIDGEGVHFENNRQARKFIEHLIRQACLGISEVHCLWGYALFGWKVDDLKSHPKRLFETMASKINGYIGALGFPPLIEKMGRNSCAWKLCWSIDSITASSDIRKAIDENENALRYMAEDSIENACEHSIASCALDPKNPDSFMTLKKMMSLSDDKRVASYVVRMKSLLKMSERIIEQHIDSIKNGISEIKAMIDKDHLPKGIDVQTASDTLLAMQLQQEFMSERLDASHDRTDLNDRPLFMKEIQDRMLAIQDEIYSVKSKGASAEQIWAQIIGSRSFERLLCIPRIKSMVNNFYNHDMQSHEDPRLVQLALVSMLSQSQSIKSMNSAKDEFELMGRINRELRKELNSLENMLV